MVGVSRAAAAFDNVRVGRFTLADDFNDNFLNPGFWRVQDGIVGTVSETNQRLEMMPTGPVGTGVGIVSQWSLPGDFDVQVDYILLNWPANGSKGLQLRAESLGVGPTGPVSIARTALPQETYLMDFADHVISTPTTDTSGTLRLVRSGATLSGYFRSSSTGGNWVLVSSGTVSTAPTISSDCSSTLFFMAWPV